MSVLLTKPAERDLRAILQDTLTLFGPRQVRAYAGIIETAIRLVGENPLRPGSIERPEIAAGVRYYHLERAAGRRGAASHGLYYLVRQRADGADTTIILRVLHDRMEPGARVMRAFDDASSQTSSE